MPSEKRRVRKHTEYWDSYQIWEVDDNLSVLFRKGSSTTVSVNSITYIVSIPV